VYLPAVDGATNLTDTSKSDPGFAEAVRAVVDPPIVSPLIKVSAYEVFHVQVPAFLILQVLVNAALGAKIVPSGIVTSLT
jgi:hypothetical protein